jgi:NTP pyrophosphatase (non-canonical NTP hydrolase)
MNLDEYQRGAMRTAGSFRTFAERIQCAALGLAGEAGEFADDIKKIVYHDAAIPTDAQAEELGDILWYLALAADALGYNLSTIAELNLDKLRRRYPDGFSPQASTERRDRR